jgi:hypothetical protein
VYVFAQEHLHWTVEDWSKILWTDETWASGGSHTRVFVTRTKDEGLEKDCFDPQVQREKAWMFWGSFCGDKKGPSFFGLRT